MTTRYDAIVIGTGQAGPPLAGRLAAAGRKTAILERKLFGGTCVNVGCIPSKTLIASARAAHVARIAESYGVVAGDVRVDMAKVKARKDAVVAHSNHSVEHGLKTKENVTVIEGHGRFEGPHTIRVNDQTIEAPQIFINTGARALVPPIPGLDTVDYLTNASMMAVDFLPEHLVILGGSYIGLEFAHMYRRFGSRVTVLERGPRLLEREDEDISAAVQAILVNEGVQFRFGVSCKQVERQGGGVLLRLFSRAPGQEQDSEITGSHLLVAIGRTPNSDDLGLDQAGIERDERGFVTVDDQLRTNVAGVWAMGDVNGRGAFTHTSYNDYEIVAANLLDDDPRRVSDRIPVHALYIDPPLARVGMTERQVRESGRKALLGTMPMTRVGRARERGETQGFMKVLVDAETKRVLGASLLGIEADEAVHTFIDLMYAGSPYTVMQRAVHIHPTVSELLPTLLGDLKPLV